uniref:RING-type E3 ubiquitin transferase n=1 Tax=Anthurium amnicola TaxID=1678845 RepID=A0A1D1Y2Q5_9ARAE
MDARYWCYMCSQMVSPIMEAEIKCPFCESGFVEEMDDRGGLDAADLGSDRTLSLWAPILLGMMGSSRRRRRFRFDDEDEDSAQEWHPDIDSVLRRRRRSSALLQLLQALRAGTDSDGERERDMDRDRDRERERVLLINQFDQAIILQGSFDTNRLENSSTDAPAGASLGDYFVEPGLDLLLQHLAENDPNHYGTPPAQKEAVEALPMVKIEEKLSCTVCLEDFDLGAEAKEMPCKHSFHTGCILPWLELHSSCPVCRFQIPADESKNANGSGGSGSAVEGAGGGIDAENDGNGRRFWLPVPWPFNGMFSLSGSQGSGNSSSSASGNISHEDEN